MAPKRKRKPRAERKRGDDDSGDEAAPSTSTSNVGLEHLPAGVLDLILRRLDHDSLFQCAFVCKAWRDTLTKDLEGVTSEVWRTRLAEYVDANIDKLCDLDKDAARKPGGSFVPNPMSQEDWNSEGRRKVRRYYAPLLAARTMCQPPESGEEKHFMHVHSGLTPVKVSSTENDDERSRENDENENEEDAGAAPDGGAGAVDYAALNPLALYRVLHEETCFDCREMMSQSDVERNAVMRTTAGKLRVRLCRSCSEQYGGKPNRRMRLVTFSRCKEDWCLRPADLDGLPYGLDTNPENARWDPMRLYRKVDVVERALEAVEDAGRLGEGTEKAQASIDWFVFQLKPLN